MGNAYLNGDIVIKKRKVNIVDKINEILDNYVKEKFKKMLERCDSLAVYKFTFGDNVTRIACNFHMDFLIETNRDNKGFEFKLLEPDELSYGHKCECLQFKEGKGGE